MSTTYELTISADYVKSWTPVEALRELLQNAIDEQTSNPSHTWFVQYNEGAKVVEFINKGASLGINTLLFGNTSKASDSRLLGNHGEGYKIATIVLLRSGCNVTFYNEMLKQVWTTKLIKSRRFPGQLIPTFTVDKLNSCSAERCLRIAVSNIDVDTYNRFVNNSLMLREALMNTLPVEGEGDILLDDSEQGNVYVGGLFVCNVNYLKYGYNIATGQVPLDRDRKLVGMFDLCWQTTKMIRYMQDADAMSKVIADVLKDGEDPKDLWYLDSMTNNDSVVELAMQKYIEACIAQSSNKQLKFTSSYSEVDERSGIHYVPSAAYNYMRKTDALKSYVATDEPEIEEDENKYWKRLAEWLVNNSSCLSGTSEEELQDIINEMKDENI